MKDSFYINDKRQLLFLALLAILNIVIRLPPFKHENGSDTFVIHSLANLISEYGHANWMLHPLSAIGAYPFSYPGGVPFMLSGISQSTSVNMEYTILLTSIFIGVFGAFTVYITGKKVCNNNFYAFLAAFSFSISIMFVRWTYWRMSTRGLVIVLAPLFLWYLLDREKERKYIHYLWIAVMLLILASIHRIAVFVVILLIIPYLFTPLLAKGFQSSLMFLKYRMKTIFPYLAIGLMTILFISSFIGISNITNAPNFTRNKFEGNGLLMDILNWGFDFVGFSGILSLFALIGVFYLVKKQNKSFPEYFLVSFSLFASVFLYDREYGLVFCLPFLALLVPYGIGYSREFASRFTTIKKSNKKNIIMCSFVLILIVFSTFFTSYIIFINNKVPVSDGIMRDWADERTVKMSRFLAEMGIGGMLISNNELLSRRVSAYSYIPAIEQDITVISSLNSSIRENLKINQLSVIDIIDVHGGGNDLRRVEDWYDPGKNYYPTKHRENILHQPDKTLQTIRNYNVKYFVMYVYSKNFYSKSVADIYNTKIYDDGLEEIYFTDTKV